MSSEPEVEIAPAPERASELIESGAAAGSLQRGRPILLHCRGVDRSPLPAS